jgi:hypothetical protein
VTDDVSADPIDKRSGSQGTVCVLLSTAEQNQASVAE